MISPLDRLYLHMDTESCIQLWRAVVWQAIEDALYTDPQPDRPLSRTTPDDQKRAEAMTNKAAALNWLLRNNRDFSTVCERAGFDPSNARQSIRRYLNAHGTTA